MTTALAKKLAKLIAMEKNTLRSMETASKERMDGAVSGCGCRSMGSCLV